MFKRASEIEVLQHKLDQLQREADQKATETTQQQQAQIAQVQAALKVAQQGAFEERQAQHKADQEAALKDYDETLHAVVETAGELRGLLGALMERRRACGALGMNPPNAFVDGLEHAVNGVFWSWDHYRPELVDAPPQPTALETAILETRSAVAWTEKALQAQQEKLAAFPGDRGSVMHRDLVRLATDYAEALQRERRRLGELLAQVEPQTDAIRHERLALEQRVAEKQTITLSV